MNPREFYNNTADIYETRQRSPWFKIIRKKENKIIKKFKNGFVLDLGCGTGEHLKYANLGIDVSEEMLKLAKKHGKKLLLADGEALPLEDKSVDTILCMLSVLNLCKDHKRMVSEMKRVLRPGGRVILSLSSIYDQGKSLEEKKDINGNVKKRKFVIKGFAHNLNIFSKNYLLKLFKPMKLIYFDSLFNDVIPKWGDWKGPTKEEMKKINNETTSDYGTMYFMVFE